MTDPSELHRPVNPVRFVTAASLFDGHDAAINIMRRLLQAQGAEVVHLGHNRSVEEVVTAAVAEDAQGVAVSSYQGGHVEYFTYLVERLAQAGRGDVLVYGGGGGVIVPSEIELLERRGVRRIFSPADGQRLGLAAMINVLIRECDRDLADDLPTDLEDLYLGEPRALARMLTGLERGRVDRGPLADIAAAAASNPAPVLGITGTGGSGKSSLTDELIRRLRLDLGDKLRIAVLAVDPTRRRGGALLGDRIRMNAIDSPQVFFRSVATHGWVGELPPCLPRLIEACRAAGSDLVVVETPGIGQGDAAVVDVSDFSVYVMTPEYGAASQLEKIDMLELADAVAINKFDRQGAADALREVRRQWRRDHPDQTSGEDPPVFGTVAAHFNDDGVTALYQHIRDSLGGLGLRVPSPRWHPSRAEPRAPGPRSSRRIVPGTSRRSPTPFAAITPARTGCPRWRDAPNRRPRPPPLPPSKGSGPVICPSSPTRCAPRSTPRHRRCWRDGRQRRTSAVRTCANPSLARRSPVSRCLGFTTTATSCVGSARRICRDDSRSPPASSPTGARRRIRHGCSPARETLSGPTGGSTCSQEINPLPDCRPPSTPSPCTAAIPLLAPTSTARWARRGSRSRPWTTWRPSSTGSTCATRRPRCR